MKVDLSVPIGRGVRIQNPVVTASGCFGFGKEYNLVYDVGRLGAITGKSVLYTATSGNPMPRLVETPAGMINSIGLPTKGAVRFAAEDWPHYEALGVPIILSVAGRSYDEYMRVAESFAALTGVVAWEINMSCPNIGKGLMHFGSEPDMAYRLVEGLRPYTDLPLIPKLLPTVTDITAIAKAVVAAGADSISMINSLSAMAIDIQAQRPATGALSGGLTGPAIKPIALRLLWQVAEAVDVPVIAGGGISTWQDAIEFMLAGASAVSVGTVCFTNPMAPIEILEGIEGYLQEKGYKAAEEIVGLAQVNWQTAQATMV
jgi:dihydroorotate dehydrogenase (NAD+) catalytic subunit